MNLRIFFLLHTDPSYTYRTMPPSLHLSLSLSPPPSPSSSFFLSTHSPSCPSSHSLTHSLPYPTDKKKRKSTRTHTKQTHPTSQTIYLPIYPPTCYMPYVSISFCSCLFLLSRYKLTLPYRTCRTVPEQKVNESIHPSIHHITLHYITFALRNVM